MFGFDPISIVFLTIILAISIGLHEYAHAYSSFKLGDPTPKLQNRLTPNPIAHLDPIGFLMIFLVHFGWGKPVEVNPSYYKNPMRDELIVALSGPATNLILGIFGILIILFYAKFGLSLNIQELFIIFQSGELVIKFWMMFCIINFALAVFNMIPIPPLDGFRLIKFFNPPLAQAMIANQWVIFLGLLFVLFFFLGPIIGLASGTIFEFFFKLLSQFFY